MLRSCSCRSTLVMLIGFAVLIPLVTAARANLKAVQMQVTHSRELALQQSSPAEQRPSPRGKGHNESDGIEFFDTEQWTKFYELFDQIINYFDAKYGKRKHMTTRLETVIRSGNLLVHGTQDQLTPPYNMLSMSLFSMGTFLERKRTALFDLSKCKVYLAALNMNSIWSVHWHYGLSELLQVQQDSDELEAAAEYARDPKTGKYPSWYPPPTINFNRIRFNRESRPLWKALFFKLLMMKVMSSSINEVYLTKHGEKLLFGKIDPTMLDAEVKAFNEKAVSPPMAINDSLIKSALSVDAHTLAEKFGRLDALEKIAKRRAATQEEVIRALFKNHSRASITELIVDGEDDALIGTFDTAEFAKFRSLQAASRGTSHRPSKG